MGFLINPEEVLLILSSMSRTLTELTDITNTFAEATKSYNATMQDATATEATLIDTALREDIQHMQELITKSNAKVQEGALGLKKIEDYVSDGGLR